MLREEETEDELKLWGRERVAEELLRRVRRSRRFCGWDVVVLLYSPGSNCTEVRLVVGSLAERFAPTRVKMRFQTCIIINWERTSYRERTLIATTRSTNRVPRLRDWTDRTNEPLENNEKMCTYQQVKRHRQGRCGVGVSRAFVCLESLEVVLLHHRGGSKDSMDDSRTW